MQWKTVAVSLVLATLTLGQVASQDPADAVEGYVWPQHADVDQALEDAATSPWVELETIGTSGDGRPLRMAVITDPASTTPMEERVVTLITTQQHGNEPAGTPAALDLLQAIVDGAPITDTLQDQVLLLWPQANPDGAEANRRQNANDVDLNRDHIHVNEPEAKALHAGILQTWDVHVGMDHHEYSGTGPGYPVPVRSYDWDATILYPRHGNVRAPTLESSIDLYDFLVDGLAEEDYEAGEYGVQTAGGVPVSHVAGGPDPGILRNNFGLNNIVGLLVETLVNDANPAVTPERRIDIHSNVMEDTLHYAEEHASELIAAKRESERLNLEDPPSEYIEEWPDDPTTGEPNMDNIRAPLDPAYATDDDLVAVLDAHGLQHPIMDGDRFIHVMEGERIGLLAAALHPESTRAVAEADPVAMADVPDRIDSSAEGTEEQSTPWPFAMGLIALLGAAMARRRFGRPVAK